MAPVCPICGLPKIQFEGRAYRCWNEEHNQRLRRAIPSEAEINRLLDNGGFPEARRDDRQSNS